MTKNLSSSLQMCSVCLIWCHTINWSLFSQTYQSKKCSKNIPNSSRLAQIQRSVELVVKYVQKQTQDRWESDDFYPGGWTAVEKAKYLRGEGGGGSIITVGIARIPANQLFMHLSHQTSVPCLICQRLNANFGEEVWQVSGLFRDALIWDLLFGSVTMQCF